VSSWTRYLTIQRTKDRVWQMMTKIKRRPRFYITAPAVVAVS
jgi:hypothetical protein